MTDQIERQLRDVFAAEAESAPVPGDLAGAVRRQVRVQRRRWSVVVGAGFGVLALVAGIVIAAGPGGSHSQPARDPVPTPSSTPLSPQAELFFSNVEQVQSLLAETPENVSRLETRRQRAYADCMHTAGFSYDAATVKVRRQPVIYEPSWWQRPSVRDAERGLGYAVLPAPEGTPKPSGYAGLRPAVKASFDVALTACIQSVTFRPEFSDPPNPAGRSLLGSMNDALYAAATSASFAPIQRRYGECMTAQGIDVREPGGIYDLAERQVYSQINKFNALSKAYRDALPKAKAQEVRIGMADVTCRVALADDIARMLSPVLADWSARNRAKVQRAADWW
jgi:hypothetical protein